MFRKLDNIAIVIFGVLILVSSFICLLVSFSQESEFRRWRAAHTIERAGEMGDVGKEHDIVIVGSIAPQTPALSEGLALFEHWKQESRYRGGEWHKTWERVYAHDRKPVFELLLDNQGVTIHGERASLLNTREVMIGYDTKLMGFAPGDGVTVLGAATSTSEPLEAKAEFICGGEREECLGQFLSFSTTTAIVAAVLLLGGGGLVWLGIRRLRARASS